MAVTIQSVGVVQRFRVTGDPSAAGSIPAMVNEGDLVYATDTGLSYVVGSNGKSTPSGNTLGKAIALAGRLVNY